MGSQWAAKLAKGADVVPDLRINTVKILAWMQDFLEIPMTAGVLPKLKGVLEITGDKDG